MAYFECCVADRRQFAGAGHRADNRTSDDIDRACANDSSCPGTGSSRRASAGDAARHRAGKSTCDRASLRTSHSADFRSCSRSIVS